jgi:hypothetical protein
LKRPHRANHGPARPSQRRHRRGGDGERRAHSITLTADGVPAATPDAPRPSPVVFVSEESRARYPWLPARVIAGSVWRGPENAAVKVDQSGCATAWPPGTGPARDRSA